MDRDRENYVTDAGTCFQSFCVGETLMHEVLKACIIQQARFRYLRGRLLVKIGEKRTGYVTGRVEALAPPAVCVCVHASDRNAELARVQATDEGQRCTVALCRQVNSFFTRPLSISSDRLQGRATRLPGRAMPPFAPVCSPPCRPLRWGSARFSPFRPFR